MDTHLIVLSFTPSECLIGDLKLFSKISDISETDPSHEQFPKDNIKMITNKTKLKKSEQ